MFKTSGRQGRSAREPEAYDFRYVEGLSDARTMPTAVFNILLGKAEGMPQPFPQTAAVYFTIHSRLRSLDEDFFHLLGTLGRGQLARLGVDGRPAPSPTVS